MKILKNTLICILSIVILIFLFCKSNILNGNIIVDNTIEYNHEDLLLKNSSTDFEFKNEYSKVTDISILFNNQPITNDVILKSQRYYISIDTLCNTLNLPIIIESSTLKIGDSITINLLDNDVYLNNDFYNLRGELIQMESHYYLSLSDIEYLFNLRSNFDFNNKEISLFNSPEVQLNNNVAKEGRIALLRLEDISAGGYLKNSDNIQKMKLMVDLLHSNSIKFHIAWVPHYIDPSQNIDNDLTKDFSIENVAFINLLDYMINKNGLIGLHGYTHQFGEETSLYGTELSRKANSTEEQTRIVIEKAISTANYLNIPISFFESPHYKATRSQKDIIQEYFKYIYEPYSIPQYINIKHTDNNIYIPTPLSYVKDLNTSKITKGLSNPDNSAGALMSLFYHPSKELDFINFEIIDNKINYSYSESSPLQQIIRSLNENKYVTSYITKIK